MMSTTHAVAMPSLNPTNAKRHRTDADGDDRPKIQPSPSSGPASLPSSSIIPLPASHIRRTPSELQLVDETRRAEYDDVRMYARLVVGMQSQCVGRGYVHPLSKKSLAGVVRTKQTDHDDLEKTLNSYDQDYYDQDDGGWEMNLIDEDQDENSSENSLWSTRPPSKSESDGSLSTRESIRNFGEDDDECVFSLEL